MESIACICASIKRDKAGGEADLPGNLVSAFPIQFAYQLIPIIHNIMNSCKEPLFWSGGIAHELLKAGGSSTRASSYRFVLWADTLGKIYRGYLRQCLVPYISSYMLNTMCGSFLRRGTDFATLYFKSFVDYAISLKHSWGALFLDISAAFESLQHFLSFTTIPMIIKSLIFFQSSIFPQSMFSEFVEAVRARSAFEEAGVPKSLTNVVAAAHQLSWFSTEGLKDLAVAHQGCKAGDPLGDLIFSFLICKILRNMHGKLSSAGICPNFQAHIKDSIFGPARTSQISFSSINYADDNVLMSHSSCPQDVQQSLEVIGSTAIDEFASHGLKCSLGPTKTACMFKFVKNKKAVLNNFIKVGKQCFSAFSQMF